MENASVHVEEGVTQLQRAKEYQVSVFVTARDNKCHYLLCLLLEVALLFTYGCVHLTGKST